MNAWDILAIVLCIGIIALVGFLIPVLIQLKDLLKLAETTVTRIETEVQPVISNVEGITQNFEGITGAANSFVNRKPSNEPGMVDNIKGSVKISFNEIKYHYLPVVSRETNRYLIAVKAGFKAALNKYMESRKDLEMIKLNKPELTLPASKQSPVAEDIVILDHQVLKR